MNNIIKDKFKEILDFIEENKSKGININSNKEDILELINIIVDWYAFKYPSEKIMMSKEKIVSKKMINLSSIDSEIRHIEHLDKYMGYTELIMRIPSKLHPIIECWYKGESETDEISNYVNIHIHENYSNNPVDLVYRIFKQDGSLDNVSKTSSNEYFKSKFNNIEELIICVNNDENLSHYFDIENPKKIVLSHQVNLELRNKIFNLIAIFLLSSGDKIVGYIRAKKFIEEFNKYIYNLDLSGTKILDIFSNRYMSLDIVDFNEEVNNIIQDLFSYIDNDKKIDEYGLSIDTIKKLKTYEIHKTSDVLKKMSPAMMVDDPIYTVRFCPRDEEIIRSIFKKAKGDAFDQIHSNLLDSLDNNLKLTNLTSPKKKPIFMKRLSKK